MDIEFDYNKLDKLIRSFYVLTKYRIAFYDTSFKKLISYPEEECPFCVAIHKSEGGLLKCQESDERAFHQTQISNDLYIFSCHAGLTEAAISLKSNGVVVGHIMFGQITREKDEKERLLSLIHNLDGLSYSEEEKEKMISSITYQTDEQIQAASTILLSIGKYAILERLFSFKKNEFLQKLEQAVNEHMEEKLTG